LKPTTSQPARRSRSGHFAAHPAEPIPLTCVERDFVGPNTGLTGSPGIVQKLAHHDDMHVRTPVLSNTAEKRPSESLRDAAVIAIHMPVTSVAPGTS
jgi:hypothetical protein